MTMSDRVNHVTVTTGLTKDDAGKAVDATVESIGAALARGEELLRFSENRQVLMPLFANMRHHFGHA